LREPAASHGLWERSGGALAGGRPAVIEHVVGVWIELFVILSRRALELCERRAVLRELG
jgi:hypothetical protein